MWYSPRADSEVIETFLEVESKFDNPYDAIARCYELNGLACDIHPLDALMHLFVTASQEFHSCAEVAASLLLNLYNGYRFPFDLAELRRLDRLNKAACLSTIAFDTSLKMEVHQWLNTLLGRSDMGLRFEWLAVDFGLLSCTPLQPRPQQLNLVSPLSAKAD